MDDWWKVVLLGILEGITEFLPVSSTGHLLIAARLLGFTDDIGGTFEIFIQLGAVLAVVGFYGRDLLTQVRNAPRDPGVRRFWLSLLIAFLPAAAIGLVLRDFIKRVLFATPVVVAASLIIGGVVLLIVEMRPVRRPPGNSSLEHLTLRQMLVIGFAQATALIPGVSRSAASIVGGLLTGLDRRTATTFAFYLSIPTLGAATLVDLAGSIRRITSDDLARLLLGTAVSFVVAWASIGWLLRYVSRHDFRIFGYYRIAAGLAILALIAAGVLG